MIGLILFVGLFGFASGKQLTIALRENITTPCPNVQSDLVDTNSIHLDFQMVGTPAGTESVDQVTVVDRSGESRTMSFPGCYRMRLSFRLKKPLENPYIESFLQLGTNLPCQSSDQGPVGTISNICTNITQTNWCPTSQHGLLRQMLQQKQTCRYCNLCGNLETEKSTLRKYVTPEQGSEKECRTDKQFQTLTFKMCTPTKQELRKTNEDNEGKLEEYWNYLKQGILTAVIHVVDRNRQPESQIRMCQKLCEDYEFGSSPSSSHRQLLLKTIEKKCSPKDDYAACVYHTVKFDVFGDFALNG
ncbi:hypothetical protein FO519_003275 [Halicephalobus sp. NKZ332]|nr:hypothetical protein FO519_003275 [Halicephalobus sp. NKZ332]